MDETTTTNGVHGPEDLPAGVDRASRPIRKDERIVSERGLYIESWLPERRSRRKPLYMLHGELGGLWVWAGLPGLFAPRGWGGDPRHPPRPPLAGGTPIPAPCFTP